MKVLVATRETQGSVAGDYSHTVDGELVYIQASDCANPRCGCDRGFAGMASHRATTTARVVERPDLTEYDLRRALTDSLAAGGWLAVMESAGVADEGVDELLDLIHGVTFSACAGALVRRKGPVVWVLPSSTLNTPEV